MPRKEVSLRKQIYGRYTAIHRHCYDTKAATYNPDDKVCDEWKFNWAAFLQWALNNFFPGAVLNRHDWDKPFSPENCYWGTRLQLNNKSKNTRMLTWKGETKSMADWSRDPRCGVLPWTIRDRIAKGWPVEDAITAPLHSRLKKLRD